MTPAHAATSALATSTVGEGLFVPIGIPPLTSCMVLTIDERHYRTATIGPGGGHLSMNIVLPFLPGSRAVAVCQMPASPRADKAVGGKPRGEPRGEVAVEVALCCSAAGCVSRCLLVEPRLT
jgi:hypothetical protein